MKRKTATIARYHIYGTRYHEISVSYRGHILGPWRDESSPGLSFCYARCVDHGDDSIRAMLGHARRYGFTHVRFTGDWSGRSVRKTMTLREIE